VTYRKWTVGPDAVIDFLNNAKLLGPFPWSGLPVGGKTLILTEPAATVTFPGAADSNVTLGAIIEALKTTIPDIHVDVRASQNSSEQPTTILKYLSLYRDGGLAITKDGTANGLLGLSTSADIAVKSPVPGDNIKSISRAGPAEYEVIVGGADADFDSPAPPVPAGGSGDDENEVVVP
jgi:hypothetical protein